MRVGGLATGMDIDSIVKQMMAARRIPLTKLNQKHQTLDWQRTAYREINSKLVEFRNMAFDMTLSSSFNASKAQSSDESVVTVSGKNAATGNYTLKIDQLAKAASLTSDKLDAGNGASTKLKDLGFEGSTKLTITGDKGSAEITVSGEDSLTVFLNTVNNQSHRTGVKVSYDSSLDRLFFTSNKTGEESKIELSSENPSLLNSLMLTSDGGTAKAEGSDAVVHYNGIEAKFSSNVFTINGMTFTAKKAQAEGEQPVNISVTKDVDAVFDNIKSFVDKYNELIENLHSKLNEPKYRDYTPLTAEQKEQMKEKEIENWEAKAKSGLLRSDPLLRTLVNDMRFALSTPVSGLPAGDYTSLSDIGITTLNYEENGKLHIDEDKLRQAISDNPDEVAQLFTAAKSGDNSNNAGFATRLNNVVKDSLTHLTAKAGSGIELVDNSMLSKDIRRLEGEISDMTRKMMQIESRYYSQFTAMEKAINQMNMQSSFLVQQFGGGM
ncbi:flagellar hook-associated protein 2 [Paenibacillus senegalensis]|uniref:flagellar hook-associated protein 2 n=1 Tax=Paenibacillus senegalensis TaxID=1465766 RepID=UPI0012F8EEB2|nr:flagellar hook-associated protein 2 [Paenibacillus senegalensis]